MPTKYRFGETKPVFLPLKLGVAINLCDLCYVDLTDGGTVKPASSLTYASAVATPVAPTVANSGIAIGTALTNAVTGVKVSYQFPWGEGALSAAGSATPTAGASIRLTGLALPVPVVGLNIYVETLAGSGIYKLWNSYTNAQVQGTGDILITGYGTGQIPAAGNPTGVAVTSGQLDVSQFNFAQKFVGCSGQRYGGENPITTYGVKDGQLRVDTEGVYDATLATAASWNVGDLFGPSATGTPTLDPQNFVAVTHKTLAVARAVSYSTTSATAIRLQVFGQKLQMNL